MRELNSLNGSGLKCVIVNFCIVFICLNTFWRLNLSYSSSLPFLPPHLFPDHPSSLILNTEQAWHFLGKWGGHRSSAVKIPVSETLQIPSPPRARDRKSYENLLTFFWNFFSQTFWDMHYVNKHWNFCIILFQIFPEISFNSIAEI